MKLSDNKFAVMKKAANTETLKLSKDQKSKIKQALSSEYLIESVFDVLAQSGGPNMLQQPQGDDVPMAAPGDVTDISDIWPEDDIKRQVQDLKQQGLAYGPMLQQLIQMGVLGTDRPMSRDVDYLDYVIKQAFLQKEAKGKPSELSPGETLIFNDGKSQYHKFSYEPDPSGQLKLTHKMSRDPELFPEALGEEVKPAAADMITRKMMLVNSEVAGEQKDFGGKPKPAPKKEELPPKAPEPEAPGVGDVFNKDMLESEKRAVMLSFLEKVKSIHQEYMQIASQISTLTHGRPRGMSDAKYKQYMEEVKSSPPSEKQKIMEKYIYPEREEAYAEMTELQGLLNSGSLDPQQKSTIERKIYDLSQKVNKEKSLHTLGKDAPAAEIKRLEKQKQALQVKISKAGNLYKKLIKIMGLENIPKNPDINWLNEAVDTDWDQLMKKGQAGASPLGDYFKVRVMHDSGGPASPAELSALLKSLGASGIVESTDEQGVFKIDLPEELEHKLIIDGSFSVHLDKFTLESYDGVDSNNNTDPTAAGTGPAGTAASPMDGQRDSLSTTEIEGTGKIGQAAPPPPSEQAPPGMDAGGMPPADPMADMGGDLGGLDEVEDSRTPAELVETIQSDVDALKSKIESGEVMMGDKVLEPVVSDSGSIPSTDPSKIAVDNAGKTYYKDYFGEYGDDMTKDRVAEVVDIIDSVVANYGTSISSEGVDRLVAFVTAEVSGDSFYNEVQKVASANSSFADTVDTILVNYIVKTGASYVYGEDSECDASMKPSLFAMALNDSKLFGKISNIINAQKMKIPQVKKQRPKDAVDVKKMEDLAQDIDSRPSQHLRMCVEDSRIDGEYTYLDISWDPDEVHGRSSMGVRNLVKSYVKGIESTKEFKDIGFLGQINFEEFDQDAGCATVYFKSSRSYNIPKTVKTV